MDKPRILIVDDDAALSRLVGLSLEKTRLYQVRVENRSRQALACAREFQPHLVLLDVDMPGMDGGAVAAQLRADTSLRDLHIIFFTSLISQKEAGQNLISRGGDLFLPKPIDTAALVHSIEIVLSQTPTVA
ncbi:MAG: response regulator [Chthoniobacterales bacterium]|nr:response regulator [Chthoniobacterales bacterium]